MKRPMTLTAGILGIVSHSLMLIFSILNLFAVIVIVGAGETASADASNTGIIGAVGAIAIVMVVVVLAVSIIGLAFNIIGTAAWKINAEDFKSKKGKIITAIVFNFIGAFSAFLVMNIILAILIMLVLIAAAVLGIVDLCLESKRNVTSESAPVQETVNSSLEDKIEKLNQMKEQGMINDEEYESLKKKYIEEQM